VRAKYPTIEKEKMDGERRGSGLESDREHFMEDRQGVAKANCFGAKIIKETI